MPTLQFLIPGRALTKVKHLYGKSGALSDPNVDVLVELDFSVREEIDRDFFSINKMLITPQSTRSIIERMNRTAQLAQEMLITEAMRCGLLLSTPPVARDEKSRSREKPLTKTSYTINLLPPNRPDDHKFILQSSFIIFLSYLNKNGLF